MKRFINALLLISCITGSVRTDGADTSLGFLKGAIQKVGKISHETIETASPLVPLAFFSYCGYQWWQERKRTQPFRDKIAKFRKTLHTLDLPQNHKDDIQHKIDKAFGFLSSLTGEGAYLECILGLPWNIYTQDNLDIAHAKAILDADHYGLREVKERIADYIAICNIKKNGHPPILCLVGPPGVGKTSIAYSIAKSLGRGCERISLGGVRDEAEIRGHNGTYINSRPGRLVAAIKAAGSMNPVIILDEIDKVGNSDYLGSVAAALLEVLDPKQNKTFRDNYLEIPFDVSKVLFIATANDISAIPKPLLDRMLVIHVSSYTLQEKLAIAKNYLVPKSAQEAGLEDKGIKLSDELLKCIIMSYTYEAGVRELERVLITLCSKMARSLLEHNTLPSIDVTNIEDYLGPRKFLDEEAVHSDTIGLANGLAWTSVGGTLLKVETLLMPGSGKLVLTGQLGEVMQESAQAALSYVRGHAQEFGIQDQQFKKHDLHIHFPDAAVPKDGPSAGITMLTCIVSAFTQRPIDHTYAMTGEIDLHGNVLPIGGVKEKILSAKRAGIQHVILPSKNSNDLKGCEDFVTQDIDIIFADNASQVIQRVLKAV